MPALTCSVGRRGGSGGKSHFLTWNNRGHGATLQLNCVFTNGVGRVVVVGNLGLFSAIFPSSHFLAPQSPSRFWKPGSCLNPFPLSIPCKSTSFSLLQLFTPATIFPHRPISSSSAFRSDSRRICMPMDGRCRDLFNGFSMVSLSLLLLNLFMAGRTAARRKKTRGASFGACTRISGNGINYLSVIAGLLRILFPFTRSPLDIFFSLMRGP